MPGLVLKGRKRDRGEPKIDTGEPVLTEVRDVSLVGRKLKVRRRVVGPVMDGSEVARESSRLFARRCALV